MVSNITNMTNIINVFVIFTVSASAELASEAPYPPSGWRPSGPEFRYPTLTSSSYLPPQRSESRAFAQASFNFQLPQRLQLPEQPSWDSRVEFNTPTQRQNSWIRQERPQPDIGSRSPQQQPFNPQTPVPQQNTNLPDQFSDPSRKFGTRTSAPAYPESSSLPSDQSSYLPPANLAYRTLDYQQSSLYLSPPQQLRAVPYTEYGPPQQQYGTPLTQEYGPPPSQEYGPPATEPTTTEQPTTTEALTTTTEAAETTTEPVDIYTPTEPTSANAVESEERSQKLTQNEEQGIYYVYHPSGLLQRIRYTTNDDQTGMEYSARLRYENVEPINGPIYTYDPETYIFRRIN